MNFAELLKESFILGCGKTTRYVAGLVETLVGREGRKSDNIWMMVAYDKTTYYLSLLLLTPGINNLRADMCQRQIRDSSRSKASNTRPKLEVRKPISVNW